MADTTPSSGKSADEQMFFRFSVVKDSATILVTSFYFPLTKGKTRTVVVIQAQNWEEILIVMMEKCRTLKVRQVPNTDYDYYYYYYNILIVTEFSPVV